MATKVNITSPVGRIVMGSMYEPSTTDAEGKPLVTKSGPNAGQPRVNYFFALAIPKGAEPHWAHTSWGQQIWAVGHAFMANAGAMGANFAWKIDDGDSQVPNKKGRKPCENEGWPGHWIMKFSGGFAPKLYRAENGGFVQITEKDAVKPGYFVEVAYGVEANGSQSQPGIYLNHSMVCLRGFGPEINFGPDVASAGFGAAPLPAGASAMPMASAIPLPGGMPAAPAALPGGMPAAPAALPGGMPAAPAGIPAVPVTPNPGFVQVPPPAAPPVPVAAPPAAPARQMTAAAGGATYEAYVTAGWSDAQLVAAGMMLP